MSFTIIFDTNYLRSFGIADYLSGRLPAKLAQQIKRAFERKNFVGVPSTVVLELDAWLNAEAKKRQEHLEKAIRLVKDSGFTITPDQAHPQVPESIAAVLETFDRRITFLKPTLDEYLEAEKRTSYRLPPHPKKVEDEEMRDRVIWCQALRYSDGGKNPVLIVSNDQLFKNGASSEEGKSANISSVEGITDLDQRLGERPPTVEKAIENLLLFSDQLKEIGINLNTENIISLEELRNLIHPEGFVVQRFELHSHADSGLASPTLVTVNLVDQKPVALEVGMHRLNLGGPVSGSATDFSLLRSRMEKENALAELRRLLEN